MTHFRSFLRSNGAESNDLFRDLVLTLLVVSLAPLTACVPPAAGPQPPPATSTARPTDPLARPVATSLTFLAEADTRVEEASPHLNYGESTDLAVDGGGDPRVESFLRFQVSGLSGPIQGARLRLYVAGNASVDGPALYASDPAWDEDTLRWYTRPTRVSGPLDDRDSLEAETWTEYDVSLVVRGNGTFSFVLATESDDAVTFSSREGSQPPELVVILADGPTATAGVPETGATPPPTPTSLPPQTNTLVFEADMDARVKESRPDRNYGTSSTLEAENGADSDDESYIRFTVSGVAGRVVSARLRVYVTTNSSQDGPAVYAVESSWTELGITWYNRPARTSEAVDNAGLIRKDTWVEYDVTSLVGGDGQISFLLAGDSDDSAVFSSREGLYPPELAVTFTGGPTPTPTPTVPPEYAILVGAGDIASCNRDGDESTARLLDTIPGTVFTTGDHVYPSGTYEGFVNCYDPTWGRHRDRTRPAPGNHDYLTDEAAGYFRYFEDVPPYYAYSLGSWRIYALNSEINISAASPQVAWLREDLAANPSECALAYWHRPRWSSGTRHGGSEQYQVLWEVLYEAGAELVINGHEHNYERFGPMDAAGLPDPRGMREIVIGTGGRDLYGFGAPLPASEVRSASAFGVLKLTLRPDGYDWEFVPTAESAFSDRGSADCR